jgi:hypothetical protein
VTFGTCQMRRRSVVFTFMETTLPQRRARVRRLRWLRRAFAVFSIAVMAIGGVAGYLLTINSQSYRDAALKSVLGSPPVIHVLNLGGLVFQLCRANCNSAVVDRIVTDL